MTRSIDFALIALCAAMLTGCATPRSQPPAATDWSTEYLGRGSVRTSVTNDTGSALFLKVRSGATTAAQVQMKQKDVRDVYLVWGDYNTVMRITTAGNISYYRGPLFTVPTDSAWMQLTLQPATNTNLTPISREEFER